MSKQKGLYQKYKIEKTNGNPINPLAEYFVLRLDQYSSDLVHTEASRRAILLYAKEIKKYNPKLAEDLITRYSN